MKYKLTSLSIYELGQRSNQEDSLYPPYSGKPSDGSLYILCDGMGGHAAGEVASGTVCEVMSRYILSHPRKDGFFDESDFNDALDAAYDALDEKDTDDIKKMGTTLTFVKFHAGGCFTAHIGDSRIYQIRPSERRILHVTRDHSLVNDLVKLGELTPEEARSSRQKNVITRAVQPHQDHRSRADCVNLTDLKAGDYFYMCSDGMLEQAVDDEIVNILSLPKPDADKIQILIGATKDNRDNHSAHLIRIVDVIEGEDAVVSEPLVKPEPGLTLDPEIEPMSQREPVKEPVAADEPERSHSSKWSMLICLLAVAAVGILAYGFRDKWKFNKHVDDPASTEIEQDEPEPAPVVAPEQVEMGTVILESVPNGAFVWLDGKETNKKTNMRIDPLPEGKHTFRLVKEGYKDLTGEFVLESGQTLTVKKTLVPKPAPKPNPDPAKPDPAKTDTKPAVKDNPTHDTPAKESTTVVLKQINDNQDVIKPAEKKEEKKEEKVEEKKEEVIEQGEVAKEENPEEN